MEERPRLVVTAGTGVNGLPSKIFESNVPLEIIKEKLMLIKKISLLYKIFQITVTPHRDELQCMFNIQTSILKTQQNLFLAMTFERAKHCQLVINLMKRKKYTACTVYTDHTSIKCELNLPFGPVCWCGCVSIIMSRYRS